MSVASRTNRSRLRWASFPALLAMVAGLVGLSAVPAATADPVFVAGGSVSGKVLGDTGSGTVPLAGINVQALHVDPDDGIIPPVTTDANGNYTLTNLPAGDYIIAFHPQNGAYLYEYWNDVRSYDDADTVQVTVGGTVTANATLTRAAHITGVVTAPGGAPLENVTVYAWDAAGEFGSTASGDQTDSLGQYSLDGLPAGNYVLEFRPSNQPTLVREFWQDAWKRADADPVAVAVGQTVSAINVQLNTGAAVSGTVQGQGVGNLAGVTVGAYRISQYGEWELFKSATTNASGQYSIVGLEAGDWAIRFSHFDNGWGQQYWQGANGRDEATLLSLVPGQTSTAINATLTQGATFSGTITGAASPSPVPLAASVGVERLGTGGTWERVTSVQANAAGVYSVKGLAPGTYRFGYTSTSAYAWEFWGDTYFADDAELVTLAGAQVDSGNDVLLAGGVTITGAITVDDDADEYSVRVQVYLLRSPGVWAKPNLFTGFGDFGFYNYGALPAGTYRVSFTDNSGSPAPYLTQWWNNKPTLETATDIVLAAGATGSNISAVMSKTPWQLTAAPIPTITGVPQAGATLTAVPGTWEPAPVALAYQWLVDGQARAGADQVTFVPGADDAGSVITVAVTGTKDGYAPATRTSAATAALLTVFSDVPDGHAFGTEINWMYSSGISRGYLDGAGVRSYHTEESVSRQAMAAFLYRLAGSPAFTPPATASFTDVPTSHPFFKEIEWMKAQAITTGNADGTFAPEASVSREAMAAFLYRFSGNPVYTPPATASFADVPTSHFFYKQVEWMKAEGITNGYPDGYHPGEAVSRQAMAAFLYRLSH